MSDPRTIRIEKLREARNLLERPGGWIQGNAELNGSYCLTGALNKVCEIIDGEEIYWDLLQDVRRVIGRHLPTWNDTPGRTQAEVIDLLDETIQRLGAPLV